MNALKQKVGPLPMWVWLAILTTLAVAYYLFAKRKSASGSTAGQPASPSDVGQPGVVVISQSGSPGSTPPPPAESKGNGNGVQEYASGKETFAQIEQQYHTTQDAIQEVNPGVFAKYGQNKKLPAGTGYTLPRGHGHGWDQT